jgi:hypothetical protein
MEGITGDSDDPTELAWRFSPVSNGKRDQVSPATELRVLVATSVLSKGQNLQDAAIVVNRCLLTHRFCRFCKTMLPFCVNLEIS